MSGATRLRLYVVGSSARSTAARHAVAALCRDHPERITVEVVDVLEEPERADADRVMATPCLIRIWPEPSRRVFGDLSDRAALVAGLSLDFDEAEAAQPSARPPVSS